MIEEIALLALSGLLSMAFGAIGAYVVGKKLSKSIINTVKTQGSELILPILDDTINEITESPDMQKKLMVVGALFGRGLTQGLGIAQQPGAQRKSKGIMGLVETFLPMVLGGSGLKLPISTMGTNASNNDNSGTIQPAY